MKQALVLAVVLLGLMSIVHCSSLLAVSSMDDNSSPAGNGLKEFKMNLANVLGSINYNILDINLSINGFWSMQSMGRGVGRSDITDRMILSGNFNVQKSVSFSE